jgi:beta-lactamase regulating signal transducer with metallopeptidase domain
MKLFLLGFVKLFEGVIFSYKHFKIWFLVPLTLWICFFFIFSYELSQLISKQLLNWIFSISNDSTLKDSNFSTFTESIISGIEWGITLIIKILNVLYVLNFFVNRFLFYVGIHFVEFVLSAAYKKLKNNAHYVKKSAK